MTIAIQQWLVIRLDFFGKHLGSGVVHFSPGFRVTTDPGIPGLLHKYSVRFGNLFSLTHTYPGLNGIPVRSDMNAVERVLVYIELPPWPS